MERAPSRRSRASNALNRALAVARPRAQNLARNLGWVPVEERVHWSGARSYAEAARGLAGRVAGVVRQPDHWVLLAGSPGPLHDALAAALNRRGVLYRSVGQPTSADLSDSDLAGLACIAAVDTEARAVMQMARDLLADPRLSEVPFEYVTGLEGFQSMTQRLDEYSSTVFMSPVLLADPSPYDIYERSLDHFEQKCGLRDYLDLYQLLASIVERRVPGDIVEFGSYKGHSGWLIASTLRALGSRRRVQLYDTFDTFPTESAGIDYFWSETHLVDLAQVRSRFSEFPEVQLVPGEIETTVPSSLGDSIALAYVDCDSYRAVSHIANQVFGGPLSEGGVMVFEDYGHPALLGCRIAVHEYFDGRDDCLRFFSQFSGLYVVLRLPRISKSRTGRRES